MVGIVGGMALLVLDALTDALPGDSDLLELVRRNPGYTLFIVGALAANLWVRLRDASNERARKYAAEHPEINDA